MQARCKYVATTRSRSGYLIWAPLASLLSPLGVGDCFWGPRVCRLLSGNYNFIPCPPPLNTHTQSHQNRPVGSPSTLNLGYPQAVLTPFSRLTLKVGIQECQLHKAQLVFSLITHLTQLLKSIPNSHSRTARLATWQKFCNRATRILYKYLSHSTFHKLRLSEKKLTTNWKPKAFRGVWWQQLSNGSCFTA